MGNIEDLMLLMQTEKDSDKDLSEANLEHCLEFQTTSENAQVEVELSDDWCQQLQSDQGNIDQWSSVD